MRFLFCFFFSPPQPRSTSAAPTGPAAAAYRSGPGPCLPFPATAPSIDGSKRRAGPRLGSNGCWRGTGGGRGGGIPRARTPAGPAAEHHPSILPARGGGGGGCGCPASPQGWVGDHAGRGILVNIELCIWKDELLM